MAAHELKRLEVKYIRDKAKSAYPCKDGQSCGICSTTEALQFHHYAGLSNLWSQFKKKNKVIIQTVEDIEIQRDRFISVYSSELYDNGVFLCKKHHDRLHKIYGRSPTIGTAKKQMRWIGIQKEKHNGLDK